MQNSDLKKKWIDLAQPRLGAQVVYATDDFFAPKERLIEPKEPVFIADKFDDNGKWMDGWESRRKRTPGHDHCVLMLGEAGVIEALDIDTRHFTGNHAPAAMVEACVSDQSHPDDTLHWHKITDRLALEGDSHNLVRVTNTDRWTHLRLNIYPDGGVARLRVYGNILKDWTAHNPAERIDLAAMEHGGRPIFCNDEHFGSLANLIAPGRGVNMGDGWETRRRRSPGHDWGILELAHVGRIEDILLDTAFFKGNYPDRCSLQAALIHEGDEEALEKNSESWPELLSAQKLEMDREQVFKAEDIGPVSHVRLNIFPDGGISRLRLFGKIAPSDKNSST